HYGEITEAQQRALLKAKMTGDYLNKAKEVVEKEMYGDWLSRLKNLFKGSVRNAQNYMEISRRWDELEPELERNPNLSIDGALQYLRTQNRMKEMTKHWTEDEQEWLRKEPNAFPAAVENLRQQLRRKHEGFTYDEIWDQE